MLAELIAGDREEDAAEAIGIAEAGEGLDGRDRRRPGRVCRYLLRPPFAHDAVEALADAESRRGLERAWDFAPAS